MPTSKIYKYNDQDGEHTMTEGEILQIYFPYWSESMKKAGKEQYISEKACIEDWVVVNWAWEVPNGTHVG